MAKVHRETTYERWLKQEGLPVVGGYGVERIADLPRSDWPRLGGKGTIIRLDGMQGTTGAYVAEIPPGGELKPEKHMYEELIYILRGRGTTEVWNGPRSEASPSFFEWQEGSLFATPLNASHRLCNGSGTEPVIFLGYTNAPLIMDIYHNTDFVFNNPYVFSDRYDGRSNYFAPNNDQVRDQLEPVWVWATNFVPDVRSAILKSHEEKGAGNHAAQLEIGDGILVSHISEWPAGMYHKGHYHGPGAVLLNLKGKGYSLIWPQEAGIRPFEAGHADQVIKVNWSPGTIFCPPNAYFHQHFNTGSGYARHLAFRSGTTKYGVEFQSINRKGGTRLSIKKGGTLIEYEDEDPEIRRLFVAECEKNGKE